MSFKDILFNARSHIYEAPSFVHSSVWGGGAPWALVSFQGERLGRKRRVTAKKAFAVDAFCGTDCTREPVAAIALLGDPERGWPEGISETDGSTKSSVTANTNAVVRAALAVRAHGPLIRAGR